MSFSSETKKELCKAHNICTHYLRAECYGLLLFAKKFKYNEIVLSTESPFVANRFMELLTQVWQVIVEKTSALTGKVGGTKLFTIRVPDTYDCSRIYLDLGHMENDVSLRINRGNLEDEDCTAAFLRGVFLCCGSVIDPVKDYHLEFSVSYKNLCSDLAKLISEVEELGPVPKVISRKGSYIAYFKDSEQIADMLTFIGAPLAAMEIMNQKIVKEIRNVANRKTNSEIANIKKTVSASMEQIKTIEKIQKSVGLEALPQDLKEVALLRLDNPELSLRDLGTMLEPPISRSGVNHRIKRITAFAEKI
ncbi:MAG TPA: DNA-binding protein WhiA [Clostridiales bacterium]|nr:DNA-binding protein WhiA [Clostridiales bacterium]